MLLQYLRPFFPELKIKDYEVFRAFHCGICSQMRDDFGLLTPYIIQSDDIILFALLADGLAGREATVCMSRCPEHPFRARKRMCHTQGIRLASQLNVILAWHILADSTTMSLKQRIVYFLTRAATKGAFQKAITDSPAIERLMQQEMVHEQALALSGNASFEASMQPAANIFSALFVYCAPDQSAVKALRRAGYALGKIFFLVRCTENFKRDQKLGRYNIFIKNGMSYEAACEYAKYQCGLAAAELANAYNLLNVKINRTLLDNIIFLGIENAVSAIGTKQKPSKRLKEIQT